MKKLIITVGPSLFKNSLATIHSKDYIYRVNGAHGDIKEISEYIDRIREQLPSAEILLDLPGNKIRTANLKLPIPLKKGQRFELLSHQINLKEAHRFFKPGDSVLADDSTLYFTVESATEHGIKFTSHSEGQLRINKGLHVRGAHQNIPFLLQKDRELIKISQKFQINYIGLSFVRNAQDVSLVKKLINDKTSIICKIETRAAVDNLNEILEVVDYILVDRGDLSADIGLEKIPSYQKFIIDKAHFRNKKVFLSTQFLKNMEEKPIPTIAEIIDLYNTFKTGVFGIQLSEETSVGKYPLECLNVVKRVIKEIDSEIK